MPVYEECQVCGDVIKFANLLEYTEYLGKCGAEFQCEKCRTGPEDE